MLKNYVSEIDRFLEELDKQASSHSVSRAEEEAKHKDIAEARDNPSIKVVNTPS